MVYLDLWDIVNKTPTIFGAEPKGKKTVWLFLEEKKKQIESGLFFSCWTERFILPHRISFVWFIKCLPKNYLSSFRAWHELKHEHVLKFNEFSPEKWHAIKIVEMLEQQ